MAIMLGKMTKIHLSFYFDSKKLKILQSYIGINQNLNNNIMTSVEDVKVLINSDIENLQKYHLTQVIIDSNNKELLDLYINKYNLTPTEISCVVFQMSNHIISQYDLFLDGTEENCAILFKVYLQNHLFDETGRSNVLRKYFTSCVMESDNLLKEDGFTEKELQDEVFARIMLLSEAKIPLIIYKKMFTDVTDYTFPHLDMINGIWNGQCTEYTQFEKFICLDDGTTQCVHSDMKPVDTEIYDLIINNNIMKTYIDLKMGNKSTFSVYDAQFYPNILNHTAIYDTLFLTDYWLKFVHRIFLLILMKEPNIGQNSYVVGLQPVNGYHRIASFKQYGNFMQLVECVRVYLDFLNLDDTTFEKYKRQILNEKLSIWIDYNSVGFSYSNVPNGKCIDIQKIQMNVNVLGEDNKIPESDHIFTHIKNMLELNYQNVKTLFPIFGRLENIYRLVAYNNIKEIAKAEYILPNEIKNITLNSDKPPAQFTEKVAFDVAGIGGINLSPRNIVGFTPRPITFLPPPHQQNTVDKLYVIRRGLGGIPVKSGCLAHSGLLLQTRDGNHHIVEYGVNHANKNEVTLKRVDLSDSTAKSFKDESYSWTKQVHGVNLSRQLSPEDIKSVMEDITKTNNYNLKNWNCHMAQEKTRRSLGLPVENSYKLNEKIETTGDILY